MESLKLISSFLIFFLISFSIACDNGSSPVLPTGNTTFPDTPNVVLISVDTLRADHLGIYGYHRDTTPNLDRFFGELTIFENATTTAPCTEPAVLQFLTGTFKPGDNKTLAEVLVKHGYNTAAIVSQNQFRNKSKVKDGYRKGFRFFDIQTSDEKDKHGLSTRTAREISDKGVDWLEDNADKGKFFLWLHYYDPHDPYEPPESFRMYDNNYSSYSSGDRRTFLKRTSESKWMKAGHIFSKQDVSHFIGLYDGEIKYTDSEIGRILATLSKTELIDDSIVIVISDHGEWLGENNRWDHCQTLHEEEIRVPFLVSVKGGRLGNYDRTDIPVSTLDIFPTLMSLLNIKHDTTKLDGVNLLNLPENRKVFSVWDETTIIKNNNWKLFYENNEFVRLYNLKKDKYEQKNLIHQYPEVGDDLMKELKKFLALNEQIEKRNKEIMDQLKSIGYMN